MGSPENLVHYSDNLQANASAADPYPYMLVIAVDDLISPMITNRMIFRARGAAVERVNQSLGCVVAQEFLSACV